MTNTCFAREARESRVPIFLRFASEMNGAWPAYTGDPRKYIDSWRMVHDVMDEEAPNVIMVWTVFTFPQKTIPLYYPGDEYVDCVGVNIYNVVYHNDNIDHPARDEDPLELLEFVYRMFAGRKPIQISEYGATHYTATDGRSYVDFAVGKITKLYTGLLAGYPRVKAVYYFDANNLIGWSEQRRINNYALTDDPAVLAAYSSAIADERYLSEVGEDRAGEIGGELFRVWDEIYERRGATYLAAATVDKYLDVIVKTADDALLLEHDGRVISWYAWESYAMVDGVRTPTRQPVCLIDGRLFIPMRDMARLLGFRVTVRADGGVIVVEEERGL